MSSIPLYLPLQPHPGQMPPESSSSRDPIPALSWEGDRMFNIYIYDYCYKRGFRKTARELMLEADLVGDATPPINARQGLLYEWWSVFWVLFQAKSGNTKDEDAHVYIQHQSAQKSQRMHPGPGQQQPGVLIPPQMSSNPQSQSQAPIRIPNGMPSQRQPPPYHTNGAMPNGINPAMGGQPVQPGQMAQQPMQGQNFGGHPNGVTTHQPPPPQGASQQPPPQGAPQQLGAQTISFNQATQRPFMNGQPQQPGQQQPRGPFTSPPMAHSPQGGPAGGQPSTQGPPGPQAPMAQLGLSPQMTPMSRSMLPPNGGAVAGPMNLQNPQQAGPQFNHPQGQGPNLVAARPPSRSKPTPSPSMAARQPPGTAGPQQQQQQQGAMGMMPMGTIGMPVMNLSMGGAVGGNLNPDIINHEFMSIPGMALNNLKHELGFGDKDIGALNMGDKMHIVTRWKQRNIQQVRKDAIPGMPGAAPAMLPPGQPQPPQMQQRPHQQSGPTNRLKRSSTSPSEENDQRNESSPPDRKRMKRSPSEAPGYPQHVQPGQPSLPQPPAPTPHQPPMSLNAQSGQPGSSQAPQAMMMMRPQMMPNTGGSGQGKPGGGTPVAQPPTGPQAGIPLHTSQMPHPQQPGLYRGGPPVPVATRTSATPQFHPTPLTQFATKPHVGMAANSPGMNGPPKDGPKDVKPPPPNGQPHLGNQQGPDVSPRNSTAGTAPPTPGVSHQQPPGPPPTSLPPPTSRGPGAQTPTPQQQPGMAGMLSMPMNISGMSDNFMFGMEDFDVFSKHDDLDFGQWLNNTEDGPNFELK